MTDPLTHRFAAPKGKPWGLCIVCALSRAAHNDGPTYTPKGRFRCPDCVTKGKKLCRHKSWKKRQ